jgi:hypothetical protein
MNVYEIVVLASWIAALWGVINASIQKSSAFESIGRAKSKWVVINVCGLIIPYVGLVTAGIYAFLVYRHLPTRSKKMGQVFSPARSQSMMDQSPGGYNQWSGADAQQTGYRAAGRQQIPCTACGTSGRVSNGQMCYPCGGKGYV